MGNLVHSNFELTGCAAKADQRARAITVGAKLLSGKGNFTHFQPGAGSDGRHISAVKVEKTVTARGTAQRWPAKNDEKASTTFGALA